MEAERIPLSQLDFTHMRNKRAVARAASPALLESSATAGNKTSGGGRRATPLETTVDDAIEVIGTGLFHTLAVTICGLGNAADAVELLCIGYILPALEANGEVENPDSDAWRFQKSFLSAAVFAGMLVGGVLAGVGSDTVGRRPVLLASLGVNAVFGLISAFTPNGAWGLLAACRIVSGMGVGGSIPSVFTLFSEYLPIKGRGFWLSCVAWFWMVGSIFAAGMAWLLIAVIQTDWRLFAAVCAIPAAGAFTAALLFLPESPRYLATKGSMNAARDALLYMARWGGKLFDRRFVLSRGGYLVRSGCHPSTPIVLPRPASVTPADGQHATSSSSSSSGGGGDNEVDDDDDAALDEAPGFSAASSAAVSAGDDDDADGTSSSKDGKVAADRRDLRMASRASSVFMSDAIDEPASLTPRDEGDEELAEASLETRPLATTGSSTGVGHAIGSSSSSSSSCCGGCSVRLACQRCGRSLSDFLHPSIRRTSLLLTVCWFTLSFGWYGLILWIPTLFAKQDFDLDPYQDAFLVAAANLPGNILAALLMDRLGRKTLLGGGMLLASALGVVFAFSQSAALTVTTACLLNMVSVGGWNSLDCLSTESFPTTLRTSAMGYLAAFGRLGSIVGQFIFGWLVDVSTTALLCTAAGMLLIGAIAGLALPQETSGAQLADSIEGEARRLAEVAGGVELGEDSTWVGAGKHTNGIGSSPAAVSSSSAAVAAATLDGVDSPAPGAALADRKASGGEASSEERAPASPGSAV